MSYGFRLSGISTEITGDNTPLINLTLSNGTTTNSYSLQYDTDEDWWHYNDQDIIEIGFYYDTDDYVLQVSTLTSEDVGDEYMINISLPEAPTQSFSDAVHQVLEESYPISKVDNVYFDDTVSISYGNLTPLTLTGDYDLNKFSEWSVEVDGDKMKYITSPMAGFVYPTDTASPIAVGVNNGAVFATSYSAPGAFDGDHTFKIYYNYEKMDEGFVSGVISALGGTTIFEADLENEVPVEVTGYENNSALMYDIYINDALCKRLKYSVLGGNRNYSTYDTTGELYVELTASTGEITLYANEGDTCHVKIVKKSRPESIMIFANKSGDAINVDASIGDILTAAKEGYTFQLAIDGQVSGSSTYSEFGTLAASLDTSTYAADFDSSVTWRGESITWSVNLSNMSISGTVGGIN